jgi:hypothetical protein
MKTSATPREVTSTPNCFFDEDFKTFRLYTGKSLYAFCITAELTLEHLYWGKYLPPGYDLRYLSQSSRNAVFNTVEAAPDRFGGRIVIGTETLDEVMKAYKESKTASIDDCTAFEKKRLENYAWRIMNKVGQISKGNANASVAKAGKSKIAEMALSFDKMPGPLQLNLTTDSSTEKDIIHGLGSPLNREKLAEERQKLLNRLPVSSKGGDTIISLAQLALQAGAAAGTADTVGTGGGSTTTTTSSPPGMTSSSSPRSPSSPPGGGGGGGNGSGDKETHAERLSRLTARGRAVSNPPHLGGRGESGSGDLQRKSSQQDMRRDTSPKHATSTPASRAAVHIRARSIESHNAMKLHLDRGSGGPENSVTKLIDNFHGLRRGNQRKHLHQTFERASGTVGKGMLLTEYSDYGTGDFRSPSFMVVDNFNGSNISPLRYKRHAIYRGKLPMPDSMPAIRCSSDREASTLVVTMADLNTGLEVDLVYGTCAYFIQFFPRFFISLIFHDFCVL